MSQQAELALQWHYLPDGKDRTDVRGCRRVRRAVCDDPRCWKTSSLRLNASLFASFFGFGRVWFGANGWCYSTFRFGCTAKVRARPKRTRELLRSCHRARVARRK